MFDNYNRRINYLRISVTDRCNYRCVYCMPECGIELLKHSEILSFDEIVEITREAVKIGITKVRLTGGEPLVRKGIVDLVSMISKIEGINDLSMTTNGSLLTKFAKSLKEAGLHRVNISLDSVDPEKFRLITRFGDINDVFEGIRAAQEAGLSPIKINCVVKENSSEPDAVMVREFCREHGLQIRFIRQMYLTKGIFGQVEGGEGGKCISCNRLRLTSDGKIKPCLFSDLQYDVRALGIHSAIQLALKNKPFSGTQNHIDCFSNIGG